MCCCAYGPHRVPETRLHGWNNDQHIHGLCWALPLDNDFTAHGEMCNDALSAAHPNKGMSYFFSRGQKNLCNFICTSPGGSKSKSKSKSIKFRVPGFMFDSFLRRGGCLQTMKTR